MGEALTIPSLPDEALDAAAEFSASYLQSIREQLACGQNLTVVLPAAAYDHADWRRAAVRDLARAYAPVRVNFISGSADQAILAALAYLASANGVTGQYLELSGNG